MQESNSIVVRHQCRTWRNEKTIRLTWTLAGAIDLNLSKVGSLLIELRWRKRK